MLKKHWFITAAAFFVAGTVLGLLNLFGPFLAFRVATIAQKRQPQRSIEWSVAIEPPPYSGAIVGIPGVTPRTTLRTLLYFKYVTPIDVNQTADIGVVLRQELHVEQQSLTTQLKQGRYISDIEPSPGTYEAPQLQWPVTLRLEGLGFDWTVNNIPLKKDTPLPATEHWTPRAKAAGDYKLRFPMRDINHAAEPWTLPPARMSGTAPAIGTEHVAQDAPPMGWGAGKVLLPDATPVPDKVIVTINGLAQEAGGSDDLILPISVWTRGMPAKWYDQITFWGSIISFIVVSVLGTGIGGQLLMKWLDARARRP